MRTVAEHLAQALALVSPLPSAQLPLAEALGCTLTQDVVSGTDLPRWDNSAMDGYAIRASDTMGASSEPVRLEVIADLPAGSAGAPVVGPGTAARIMTGAPLPPGTDAVVPVEATDGGTSTVLVSAAAVAGAHIRRAGEDLHAGDLVVAAHTRLGARQLAAIASVGAATVMVRRRPVVAVISTGSELVPAGTPLDRGQIPDSNSLLLASLLSSAGCLVRRIGGVADDPAELSRVLDELDGAVDLVVTSGGVSMGAYEVVRDVLAGLPSMAFVQVAMQPGKPQGLGTLAGGTPILCLPGNPVSAFVSFEVFVRPVLDRLDGRPGPASAPFRATADDEWRTPLGRTQYMPVVLTGREPDVHVRRAVPGGSGSHLVARAGTRRRARHRPCRRRSRPGRRPARHPEDPVIPDQPFAHLDAAGQARMVDVTEKSPTAREATAEGFIRCTTTVVAALRSGEVPKGDVLAVARVAGIAAAKRTPDLLPLAHVIGVHGVVVDLEVVDAGVAVRATVRTADRTGVEMEAMVAVSVAALAIVDMVKGLDRTVEIERVRLLAKSGGRSGAWSRTQEGENR